MATTRQTGKAPAATGSALTGPRIVLASVGSAGDIVPILAVAEALRDLGARVGVAANATMAERVQAAGLAFCPIMDTPEAICARLGITREEMQRRLDASSTFFYTTLLPLGLADSVTRLEAFAQDADLIAATPHTMAPLIVAEKRGIAFVPISHTPSSHFLPYDPAAVAGLEMMRAAPGRLGALWNKAWFGLIRRYLRARWGGPVNVARRAHGLARLARAPYVDLEIAAPMRLCLYPRDLHPGHVDTTGLAFSGFPMPQGGDQPLDPVLSAFLEAGPPPIAVTYGSTGAGSRLKETFFRVIRKALAQMGARAVLITGEEDRAATVEGDILTCGFVPYGAVFGACSLVVHHGGLGTAALALAAGVPQVIIPKRYDQPDNAMRFARLGVALRLDWASLSPGAVAAIITRAQNTPDLRAAAQRQARAMAGRDGAARAAELLIGMGGAAASNQG